MASWLRTAVRCSFGAMDRRAALLSLVAIPTATLIARTAAADGPRVGEVSANTATDLIGFLRQTSPCTMEFELAEDVPPLAHRLGWEPYTGVADMIYGTTDGREFVMRHWFTRDYGIIAPRPASGYDLPYTLDEIARTVALKGSIDHDRNLTIRRTRGEVWGPKPSVFFFSPAALVPLGCAICKLTVRLTANCRSPE